MRSRLQFVVVSQLASGLHGSLDLVFSVVLYLDKVTQHQSHGNKFGQSGNLATSIHL